MKADRRWWNDGRCERDRAACHALMVVDGLHLVAIVDDAHIPRDILFLYAELRCTRPSHNSVVTF